MFQRALVAMFQAQDMDVVFMETVMNPKKNRHAAVHVVPLSKDDGAMAPMFFKVCQKRVRFCFCI